MIVRRVLAAGDVVARRAAAGRLSDYLELTKPRVTGLVLLTTVVGFYLGSRGAFDLSLLLATILGTALVAAGTSALNQYAERDADARMLRTRGRPLPAGRLDPSAALLFGTAVSLAGLAVLGLVVNPLAAGLAAFTLLSYVFVYTPLKRVTTLSTLFGAVPGALPPVIGWAAAQGEIGAGGVALFAILFVWQLPHSLAIAWMYRDDYARGGFVLLPVVDPDGGSTARQIVAHCLVLLPVSLVPSMIGMSGSIYFFTAVVLGLALSACALPVVLNGTVRAARRLLLASVVYLPALLLAMALDRLPPPLR